MPLSDPTDCVSLPLMWVGICVDPSSLKPRRFVIGFEQFKVTFVAPVMQCVGCGLQNLPKELNN